MKCPISLVIAEYKVDNPQDPFSCPSEKETKVVLSVALPSMVHHSGWKFFGRDGLLYIMIGKKNEINGPKN